MMPAQTALRRLREGNARFVARAAGKSDGAREVGELQLPQEQAPLAIILGCSDARVPAEIVFDLGPGDLFVIRVAGNIVAPSQLGSIEFAASNFGTRLVVVLGHSRCGAVEATIGALRNPQRETSRNLRTIVGFIKPAVEPLLANHDGASEDELLENSVRANVFASVRSIQQQSEILTPLIHNDGLEIVGAEYSLKTGRVDFFEATK
ncbi:MAG: carbonic anhydrase [Woeseia sp.]|nr:carbonic anhydrase [Woeseia sp.]MBT8096008.1 carbonic anhydrase [Woeseia sp.]NNE59510.1 carbonic anhydrase [Woeseia sp.]NNL54355.1 carbonic anhydrase [Woeseia sp.]